MNFKKTIYLLLLIGCFFTQKTYSQFEIPKIPEFQTSVYDYAKILSNSEKQALEAKLIRYSDTTSTQIVVATIKSLNNEDIGILTPRWAHKWGIGGSKEKDNGVFILLAEKDRKIWISPGYGVEHKLTAGITGELVRNVIIPEFKKGSYYSGLDKGSDAIFQVLNGEYQGTRQQNSDGSILPFILFIIFIVIIFILISRGNKGNGNGNRRSYRRDGNTRGILETIILSNSGRSSGGFGGFGGSSGGGSFGGGGFGGGFGGGGFSGGGAGGGW